jgi:hypothetical protein
MITKEKLLVEYLALDNQVKEQKQLVDSLKPLSFEWAKQYNVLCYFVAALTEIKMKLKVAR